MAFGFNDFASFFDPVSDLLGTSGKKGVGLLQQKPEDIALTAAAVYLATNGIPVTPETLAAAETATATGTAEAAAQEAARVAAEQAAAQEAARVAAEQAAQESARQGILQANQLPSNLVADVNSRGIQTADAGGNFLDRFYTKGIELDPSKMPPDYTALNTEQPFARTSAYADLNKVPSNLEAQINAQQIADYGTQPIRGGASTYLNEPTEELIKQNTPEYANYLDATNTSRYKGSFDDYQRTNLENEFAKRSAAAPPSNIQHFENPASTTQNVFRGNPAEAGFQPPQVTRGGYFNNGINGNYTDTLSPFERGMDTAGRYFDKAADYVEKNPFKSAGLAYYGAYKTGMLDQKPVEAPKDNYKNPYTMTDFRRSAPNPSAYQYKPRYAQGGIASVHDYKRGGRTKTEAAMDFYDAMNPEPAAAPSLGDVGIYYDADPDTRYLDPMEAAMTRMSKLNSRTNVQAPTMTPARRMGELDFKPVAAAQGGIMHFAEGGYSAPSSGTFAPGTEAVKDYAFDALSRASQRMPLNLIAPGPMNFDSNASSTPAGTPVTNTQSAGSAGSTGGGGGGYSSSPEGRAERDANFVANKAGNEAIGAGIDLLGKVVVPGAILGSFLTPTPTPTPTPITMDVTETYRGDLGDPGPGWTRQPLGKGEQVFTRQVSIPKDSFSDASGNFDFAALQRAGYSIPGIGGGQGSTSGGYTVGGYTPGSAEAARAASGQFGMDPSTRGNFAAGLAQGGITSIHAPYNLGGYAAGGNPRLLRGPGDGMSDNIPATINNRQPARLADGEYVITADVVSHLGNGSTEAGAKQLDAMMKRIRKGRTGTSKQGKQIDPRKYLPA